MSGFACYSFHLGKGARYVVLFARQCGLQVLLLFWGGFFGVLFWCPKGPKRVPKRSKFDEKEVSKRYLKKGLKKAAKMVIFGTPQCGSSIINNSKINDFHVLILAPFWVSVWGRFGSPNGGQNHQNVVPKSRSKKNV